MPLITRLFSFSLLPSIQAAQLLLTFKLDKVTPFFGNMTTVTPVRFYSLLVQLVELMPNLHYLWLQVRVAASPQEKHRVDRMSLRSHAPPIANEIPSRRLHGAKMRFINFLQYNLGLPHLFKKSGEKTRFRTIMQTRRSRGGRRFPELLDSFVNQAAMLFRLNLRRAVFAMSPRASIIFQFAPTRRL